MAHELIAAVDLGSNSFRLQVGRVVGNLIYPLDSLKESVRLAAGLTPEKAEMTRSLAANQGLYNGFLAAGLAWGLSRGVDGYAIRVFFLGCVIIAGIFGAATASRKILYVQAVPGAIALALTFLAGK